MNLISSERQHPCKQNKKGGMGTGRRGEGVRVIYPQVKKIIYNKKASFISTSQQELVKLPPFYRLFLKLTRGNAFRRSFLCPARGCLFVCLPAKKLIDIIQFHFWIRRAFALTFGMIAAIFRVLI